ncbi:MAG: hypothetical protein ACREMA_05990 [Longimicrobiales bacterium]
MAGRVYTISFDRQAFTTANGDYDFFELTPADDRPIELVALFVSQKSEVGDAQEEQIAYSIVSDNATSGNGSAATPRPIDPRDAAAGFTAETVGSTPASTGTAITLHADCFNVRTGLQLIFPPDMRPRVDQADTMLCVRLLAALADDADFSGTVYVREL